MNKLIYFLIFFICVFVLVPFVYGAGEMEVKSAFVEQTREEKVLEAKIDLNTGIYAIIASSILITCSSFIFLRLYKILTNERIAHNGSKRDLIAYGSTGQILSYVFSLTIASISSIVLLINIGSVIGLVTYLNNL